jgi:hypothetical protein
VPDGGKGAKYSALSSDKHRCSKIFLEILLG